MLCSIVGCERTATKRGYCDTHYRRWQRGKPIDGAIKEPFSLEDLTLRQEAKANGLTTYISPRSCDRGHTERYTSDGKCAVCIRARASLFRKENPDIIALRNAAYYAAHSIEILASNATWKLDNTDDYRVKQAALYILKRDERLAYAAAQRKAKPAEFRIRDSNKRARRRKAEGSHTVEEIQNLFKMQKGKCAYFQVCGNRIRITKNGFHKDHIISLLDGGSNWISNIQLTCRPCNCRKKAKDPLLFARQIGLLL